MTTTGLQKTLLAFYRFENDQNDPLRDYWINGIFTTVKGSLESLSLNSATLGGMWTPWLRLPFSQDDTSKNVYVEARNQLVKKYNRSNYHRVIYVILGYTRPLFAGGTSAYGEVWAGFGDQRDTWVLVHEYLHALGLRHANRRMYDAEFDRWMDYHYGDLFDVMGGGGPTELNPAMKSLLGWISPREVGNGTHVIEDYATGDSIKWGEYYLSYRAGLGVLVHKRGAGMAQGESYLIGNALRDGNSLTLPEGGTVSVNANSVTLT